MNPGILARNLCHHEPFARDTRYQFMKQSKRLQWCVWYLYDYIYIYVGLVWYVESFVDKTEMQSGMVASNLSHPHCLVNMET